MFLFINCNDGQPFDDETKFVIEVGLLAHVKLQGIIKLTCHRLMYIRNYILIASTV